MKIVNLKNITLISSTIPEDQYNGAATPDGEWTPGTYADGDVVYYTGTTPHKVYQSISASNTATPGEDVTKWTDLGATDRWLLFDAYMNTQTSNATSFTVVVDAADCDYVGVFNCDATSITFALSDDGVVKKSETISLEASFPKDYDEWFFWPSDYKRRAAWEYPQYSSATTQLSVTVSSATGDAKCGVLAIGKAYMLGMTEFGAEVGFNDYSYKYENDTTGAVELIPGNYKDTGSLKMWADNDKIDSIKRRLVENRGKAAIYDFNNNGVNFEALVFYGIVGKVRTSIDYQYRSRISFTMEGMI